MEKSTVIMQFFGVENPEQLEKDVREMTDALADGGESAPDDIVVSTVPDRDIPTTNDIGMFLHCRQCLKSMPDDQSLREWSRLDVGFTPFGFQVWCKRHECNVIHMDFQGQRHPANTSSKK